MGASLPSPVSVSVGRSGCGRDAPLFVSMSIDEAGSSTLMPASYMPRRERPARPSSRRAGCALAKDMTVVAPARRIAGEAGAEGPRTTVWASEESARRRGMVLLTNADPEMKT